MKIYTKTPLKGTIYILLGEATLSNLFCLPSEKMRSLKGNSLLPFFLKKKKKKKKKKDPL